MGGATSAPGDLPPARDLVVTLAGPAAGLALGGLVVVLAPAEASSPFARDLSAAIVAQLVWVNIGWGLLNLVPILPLDGGRVLHAVLDLLTRGRGERPARAVSVAVAAAALVAALSVGFVWAALLAGLFGIGNLGGLLRRAPGPSEHAGELGDGYRELAGGSLDEAGERARRVLGSTRDRQVAATATNLLFWSRLLDGRAEEAAESLASSREAVPILHPQVVAALGEDAALEHVRSAFRAWPSGGLGDALVRALVEAGRLDEAVAWLDGREPERFGATAYVVVSRALVAAGRPEDSAALGERLFERLPQPGTAYAVAWSHARAGREEPALRWLETAARMGYRDVDGLDADRGFEPLRGTERYEAVRRLVARGPGGS